MKSNLMIKKYSTEFDNGTKNMNTVRTFFGTKLIDIEDDILINNLSIKYSDYNGYQKYEHETMVTTEIDKFIDLSELKKNNHDIVLQTQDMFNIENNTKWVFNIDVRYILKEYLFGKIKESRSFKSIRSENTLNNDINDSIYTFIENNIIDRYSMDRVELYIKYDKLKSHNIFNKSLLQYDPEFDESVYNMENIITNFSLIKSDQFENLVPIRIMYNQTERSDEFKFNYYFDIRYKRI